MNQILCTSYINIIKTDYNKKYILKKIFYIFSSISLFFTLYYSYFLYDRIYSEQISKKLIENFNITNIYSDNSDYIINPINKEEIIYNTKNLSSYVVGIIEIKKIGIVYPILSEINKDFLKISPCRFYGPNPNEIGNICIAAHNYKNGSFFSNISQLVNGDIITIYDLTNNYIDYVIFNIYISKSDDLSCINQETNNKKIVTLITCDSRNNKYRTIVQAKQL